MASIKLLVVGWHELCLLIVGVLCGGEVELLVPRLLTPPPSDRAGFETPR